MGLRRGRELTGSESAPAAPAAQASARPGPRFLIRCGLRISHSSAVARRPGTGARAHGRLREGRGELLHRAIPGPRSGVVSRAVASPGHCPAAPSRARLGRASLASRVLLWITPAFVPPVAEDEAACRRHHSRLRRRPDGAMGDAGPGEVLATCRRWCAPSAATASPTAACTSPRAPGAAMWLPPGVEPDGERLGALLPEYGAAGPGVRPRRSDGARWALPSHEPHWYLPLIGVDPALQGRGWRALMRHALARCDADGLPADLESTNRATSASTAATASRPSTRSRLASSPPSSRCSSARGSGQASSPRPHRAAPSHDPRPVPPSPLAGAPSAYRVQEGEPTRQPAPAAVSWIHSQVDACYMWCRHGTAYSHWTLEERCRLRGLMEMGLDAAEIARRLGRHRATIYREIERNRCVVGGYRPESAARRAWARKLRGSRIARSIPLRAHVEDRLAMGWSPEQIARRMELEGSEHRISVESIYRYVGTRGTQGRAAAAAPATQAHGRGRAGAGACRSRPGADPGEAGRTPILARKSATGRAT